jgi:GT2 family glycosyltransferase
VSNLTTVTETQHGCLSIGVLVLNYNTWSLALRTLHEAHRLEPDAVSEFVLFDDGSPDPPPDEIDHPIRLIRSDSNRGFAPSLVAAFASMQSDIVVLFDSDAYPLTPFAEHVRRQFEIDPRLGQLGFFAQNESGSQTESYLGEPSQWSLILGQALYARIPKPPLRASRLCVITGCMATRMTAYRQIGGFDPAFDFLDVDVDYSMRLRRAGWSIRTDSSLKVFHLGGGTPQLQRTRVFRFYKCRWYLLRKHRLFWSPKLARLLILARLYCEAFTLKFFGRLLFPKPEVLEDKLLGRDALISYCRTSCI